MIWYILKKKECTYKLYNIKKTGKPKTTTKVDEGRILSLVNKNTQEQKSGEIWHLQSGDTFTNVNTESLGQGSDHW